MTLLGALLAAPTPSAPPEPEQGRAAEPVEKAGQAQEGVVPIKLTAFGDIYYAHRSRERDDFYIGSLEVDVTLELVPYVTALGAIAYDPTREAMTLAWFMVDSGLWGKDEHAFWKSSVIDSSGLVLGKFDVPFGIAYLHYGSPDNRLVTQPTALGVTHGGWNDLGAELYGSTALVNALAYVVNGSGLPTTNATGADAAAGGRLGLKPLGLIGCDCSLELGASAARSFGPTGSQLTLLGADLSATVGKLQLDHELIDLRHDGGPHVRGFYSQGVYQVGPAFLGGRYAVTAEGQRVTERTLTGSAGLEIFAQGELRVAYERGLEAQADALFIQIVGGSNLKPTGLRR